MQQPAPFAGLLCATLTLSCGTSVAPNALNVGADDDGAVFTVLGGDGGQGAAFDAYIEQNQVAVKFVTLACSGDCATVRAVGTGGYPPYSFVWENGSTSPLREVCPTSNASYAVKVTDTGTVGELPRPPQTVQASLTADVLACPDASLLACSDGGAAGAGVLSGRYAGTVSCPPDGGVFDLPTADGGENSGMVTLDLSVNGAAVGGSVYFLWSIGGTIAWQAGLEGTLDCSEGDLQATWENPQWGLPTTGPDGGMTLIPTGTGTGSTTAAPVSGSPGTISRNFDFTPSTGGFCHGTYTATLAP